MDPTTKVHLPLVGDTKLSPIQINHKYKAEFGYPGKETQEHWKSLPQDPEIQNLSKPEAAKKTKNPPYTQLGTTAKQQAREVYRWKRSKDMEKTQYLWHYNAGEIPSKTL